MNKKPSHIEPDLRAEPLMFNDAYIVFFDGVCGMCNSLVNFLMRIDKNHRLLFSPLQGETAQQLLPKTYVNDLDTFVFYAKGKLHERSSAGIRTLMAIGGIWKLMGFFLIFPPFLRNVVYNFIAKRRYKWFGKHDACRIPTPEELARFLP